jgi:hypothetical protein
VYRRPQIPILPLLLPVILTDGSLDGGGDAAADYDG